MSHPITHPQATALPSRAMCLHATSALLQLVKTHPPSLDQFAGQGGLLVSAELVCVSLSSMLICKHDKLPCWMFCDQPAS